MRIPSGMIATDGVQNGIMCLRYSTLGNAMREPSSEKVTDITQSQSVLHSSPNFLVSFPVVAFQVWIVLSYEPDTIRVPSSENATDVAQAS